MLPPSFAGAYPGDLFSTSMRGSLPGMVQATNGSITGVTQTTVSVVTAASSAVIIWACAVVGCIAYKLISHFSATRLSALQGRNQVALAEIEAGEIDDILADVGPPLAQPEDTNTPPPSEAEAAPAAGPKPARITARRQRSLSRRRE